MDIRSTILQKPAGIEAQHGVRILHACESGSRARGFAPLDSDYEVRFVYVRSAAGYLRIDSPRDVIEAELNDVCDISGWDLKKFLLLFLHSHLR